jgi:glucosamine--fructose-6-phosphate aminotransferase (isomerizing)
VSICDDTATSLMAREMRQQPDVTLALTQRHAEIVETLGPWRAATPRGCLLVARGSSDHAADFARYLFEAATRTPSTLVAPSLLTRYDTQLDVRDYLAVALSQSGRTPEITSVVAKLRDRGAWTVAITNTRDAPLARAADAAVCLDAGLESAVPATKTFTGQILSLAILGSALADAPFDSDAARAVAVEQRRILDDEDAAREPASFFAQSRSVLYVGSGYLRSVALEGALKLIETAGVPANGYSASDVLHGPAALAGPESPVVCLATPGPVQDDVKEVARRLADRGCPIAWVGADPPISTRWHLSAAPVAPETLMPLVHAVRVQQLALLAAIALGRDPDRPAGLTKVTATT